ncbi:MAG: proteasome-activating nucleotidase [Euryarchaeota archaeon]|jgi:proteasome regulatory subunit|nr:proteasome-activating nucleotidase [Euryarchaeota archaeon]MBT4392025.1 proteasome-activating nucleotidase [Euryarchaeota archaeon]MBT4802461.1 proteasome-activating nucleotidase [Euryarchaeota archaeon]MBT5614088.1 proteasome-activating nucleotidase [Euryarchaeota archaeon]MBT6684592.1 proteasome-activating nucleotidase [Euryarchaeota archaeon]
MSSKVNKSPNKKISIHNTEDISDSFENLHIKFTDLSDTAQQLLTDKLFLENECSRLKKRANRLDEELSNLRSPPFVIGHIQDRVNDNAIVRSSNGTVFLVSVNSFIDQTKLVPGARVALNQDNLSVIDVLDDAWDPLVSSAEIIESPNVSFSDIGGLEEQIKQIRQAIELPIENPEAFLKFGIESPKGVLLAGPPGTGKTLLAKAVATSTKATFLGIVGSELAQKYIGEGGRMVRELFDLASQKAPSIIFIDEIDSIGSKRLDSTTSGDREVQRTLMQLLAEMDGFDSIKDVKIIAATNRPELLDAALLRSGRFDRVVNLPLPQKDARVSILNVHTKNTPLSKNVDINYLSNKTDGFSGAELKSLVVEAAINAISENRNSVNKSDFVKSIETLNKKKNDSPISNTQNSYS